MITSFSLMLLRIQTLVHLTYLFKSLLHCFLFAQAHASPGAMASLLLFSDSLLAPAFFGLAKKSSEFLTADRDSEGLNEERPSE